MPTQPTKLGHRPSLAIPQRVSDRIAIAKSSAEPAAKEAQTTPATGPPPEAEPNAVRQNQRARKVRDAQAKHRLELPKSATATNTRRSTKSRANPSNYPQMGEPCEPSVAEFKAAVLKRCHKKKPEPWFVAVAQKIRSVSMQANADSNAVSSPEAALQLMHAWLRAASQEVRATMAREGLDYLEYADTYKALLIDKLSPPEGGLQAGPHRALLMAVGCYFGLALQLPEEHYAIRSQPMPAHLAHEFFVFGKQLSLLKKLEDSMTNSTGVIKLHIGRMIQLASEHSGSDSPAPIHAKPPLRPQDRMHPGSAIAELMDLVTASNGGLDTRQVEKTCVMVKNKHASPYSQKAHDVLQNYISMLEKFFALYHQSPGRQDADRAQTVEQGAAQNMRHQRQPSVGSEGGGKSNSSATTHPSLPPPTPDQPGQAGSSVRRQPLMHGDFTHRFDEPTDDTSFNKPLTIVVPLLAVAHPVPTADAWLEAGDPLASAEVWDDHDDTPAQETDALLKLWLPVLTSPAPVSTGSPHDAQTAQPAEPPIKKQRIE
jgi:hypothetical protein